MLFTNKQIKIYCLDFHLRNAKKIANRIGKERRLKIPPLTELVASAQTGKHSCPGSMTSPTFWTGGVGIRGWMLRHVSMSCPLGQWDRGGEGVLAAACVCVWKIENFNASVVVYWWRLRIPTSPTTTHSQQHSSLCVTQQAARFMVLRSDGKYQRVNDVCLFFFLLFLSYDFERKTH